MDSSLLDFSADAPWFVHIAAEPLLQLLEAHPHLNVSALASTPPANPFRINKNHLDRRDSCYSSNNNSNGSNNNNNNPTNPSSGPSGALIGGIVGAVVGVLLLVLLAWFLWRRRRRQQQQNTTNMQQTNANMPPPGIMPTPYNPGYSGTPPTMKQTAPGGYDMMNGNPGMPTGPNYTPAVYPAPPSSSGWSGTNTGSGAPLTRTSNPQDRQSYYNYAPPPSDPAFMPNHNAGGNQPMPWNPAPAAAAGAGVAGATAMYSNTPSPPPPSTTPGATSAHSGTTSGYAPWSIPHTASPGPSISGIASGSSSPAPPPHGMPGGMVFPTAVEEKAHYSGYQPPGTGGSFRGKEEEAKSRTSAPTPAPPAYEPFTGRR